MIHDYYLSSILSGEIKGFEAWKTENEQRLKNKKEENEILEKQKENSYTDFYPSSSDLQNLPQNSTLIKILFTLKKPYTSKDKGEFHIMDGKIFENPIVRDKFTGLPIVKPSTWKGHLRFAADRVEWDEIKKRNIIRRLFGSEPEEKESPLKGRLYFFPTFFTEDADRDIITPLKRNTRTPAKGPINLEVIRPGKKGEFYLLYIPYPKGEDFREEDVEEDLRFLAEALKLMFYVYGFSAKKTSGFGVIKKLQEGNIEIYPEDKKEIFLTLSSISR